jgi:hypothetical protein
MRGSYADSVHASLLQDREVNQCPQGSASTLVGKEELFDGFG